MHRRGSLGPHQSAHPNGTSMDSSVFAGLTGEPNIQARTDAGDAA